MSQQNGFHADVFRKDAARRVEGLAGRGFGLVCFVDTPLLGRLAYISSVPVSRRGYVSIIPFGRDGFAQAFFAKLPHDRWKGWLAGVWCLNCVSLTF